jgi:phosphatidylinositol 4-kinase
VENAVEAVLKNNAFDPKSKTNLVNAVPTVVKHDEVKARNARSNDITSITESPFSERLKQTRADSPYGSFTSYRLRAFIVKSGDDMRQEYLLLHFISVLRDIFIKEKVGVFLMDLDFILLGKSSAMIEYIPDSNSISGLKKLYNDKSLLSIFKLIFNHNFHEAQKNFVESFAGYSVFCYLFQVKDRHNSNILIDSFGHLIHIDFGFCLAASPGNLGFETAPFKFTQDYLDIIGGNNDYMYFYFRSLLFKSFEVLKKHADYLFSIVDVMRNAEIPCFRKFDFAGFKNRFHCFLLDNERWDFIDQLISDSFSSKKTTVYDQYQEYVNNIVN